MMLRIAACFAVALSLCSLNGPTDPPGLAWARFPDATVLYWSDGAASLLQAPSLVGPWNVVSNVPKPFVLAPSAPQQFFRLKR
ncbi:MAG TPA: hypothetical protein VNZ64_19900 [Candidatus Acidoferrum sp.]|jgi:hypothetical protein|nr:hypothetical protein [Candidatus Acidoferrum sp.]